MQIALSNNELAIISVVSPHWFLVINKCLIDKVYINEPAILEAVAKQAFIENQTGPAVDALRRALICLNNRIWRGTEEYENLIKF